MKKFLSILLIAVSFIPLYGQNDAEKWTFSAKQINDSVTEITLFCNLPKNWHIYSQHTKGTEMPIEFKFKQTQQYKPLGGVSESKSLSQYDQWAKDTTRYFENNATFRQKIKVVTDKDFTLLGTVTYQLCEQGACIPPQDVDFSVLVKGNKNLTEAIAVTDTANELSVAENEEIIQDTPLITTQTQTLQPQNKEIHIAKADNGKKTSLINIFLIAFGVGLATIITPCVFPMLPMTVSFFLRQNKSKRKARLQAYAFGLSIIFIFAVLGLILTLLFGKDALYIISTNWILNLLFFFIFIAFALSFFGLYDIRMPGKLINSADKQSEKGGFVGVFFIALTTVLVSFSCTGPILGAALVEIASGSSNSSVFFVSMIGFAIGFALPFTLLAMFPTFLKSLKSGAWLNSVKIVFGFLELALSLKFLTVADQVCNWGLLSRTAALCIWIVIFAMIGFYILGKIQFKGDVPLKSVSVPRLFLSIASFSFTVYLIPGLWGAPLSVVSGYLPPATTQEYNLEKIISGNSISESANTSQNISVERKYSQLLDKLSPLGYTCFYDINQAKQYAKQVNKPIFIDFTGKSCSNCREMEATVFANNEIKQLLNEKFVFLSLFCDENTIKLDSADFITSDNKTITTLGRKNLNYQIQRFGTNAQPLYVIIDSNGNLLTPAPMAYNKNITQFKDFLLEGLKNYK